MPAWQTVEHVPQWLGSVCRSTHVPLHVASPLRQPAPESCWDTSAPASIAPPLSLAVPLSPALLLSVPLVTSFCDPVSAPLPVSLPVPLSPPLPVSGPPELSFVAIASMPPLASIPVPVSIPACASASERFPKPSAPVSFPPPPPSVVDGDEHAVNAMRAHASHDFFNSSIVDLPVKSESHGTAETPG